MFDPGVRLRANYFMELGGTLARYTTRQIPAYALRQGDVIVEAQDDRRDKTTIVRYVTRYSKHATNGSKTHHTGCRGIHVNGSACWDADALLNVTRENSSNGMEDIAREWLAMNGKSLVTA